MIQNRPRFPLYAGCSLFSALGGVALLAQRQWHTSLTAFLTCALLLFLPCVYRLFSVELSPSADGAVSIILFASLVLGEAFGYYVKIPWWDDALHALAGGVFCLCGMTLFQASAPRVGGLSLALAVSSFWELIEYSADRWMGTDMQKDSPISPPFWNVFEQPFSGGVDIGLYDTMNDILMGFLGGGLLLIWLFFSRKNSEDYMKKV